MDEERLPNHEKLGRFSIMGIVKIPLRKNMTSL